MLSKEQIKSFDFESLFSELADYYEKCTAQVKKFEAISSKTPLQILISAMLSARTNDATTTKVIENWQISELYELDNLTAKAIEKLIYPVGFYKQKAVHLSKWHEIICKEFAGELPANREKIMSLPGVGLKTANLFLSRAYDLPYICVDIHVHRICARIGLTSGKSPAKTERELTEILPVRFIQNANRYFVALGQTLCKASTVDCGNCPITKLCSKIGV